jgi:oxygen-independent coproporphyrinogen III oxidase
MPLGLYSSVPFCRTKCTYCNFASDVFSKAVFQKYVDRICRDVEQAGTVAGEMGGRFERSVDSIYLGGGTPTVLDVAQLERIFVTVSQIFQVAADAEITVECAPGTLTDQMIACFRRCGVNRVSLGVQSFVDQEAASVGRLHKRDTVLDDIGRLRSAGIANLNVDLIAGLPHQTVESWEFSVDQTIASGVPHVSVYMLEVDEDSRLGRELIAGGTKYHAHFVPDEDVVADMYILACERLEAADSLSSPGFSSNLAERGVRTSTGVTELQAPRDSVSRDDSTLRQYEISNFARPGFESRHNLKYWTRQPYLGFGVDAHSMLTGLVLGVDAVRFSTPDSLEEYVAGGAGKRTVVDQRAALEETFFLGLRLNRGIDLDKVAHRFGKDALAGFSTPIAEFVQSGLLEQKGSILRLTSRGRLLSNEVFERFLAAPQSSGV